MNITNNLLTWFGASITIFIELLCFSKITSMKFKINYKNIIIIVMLGLLVTLNILFSSNEVYRTCISLCLLLYASTIIFDCEIYRSLFYTIIIYIVGMTFEVILSIILLQINILDFKSFENNGILKLIFSLTTIGCTYYFLKSKRVLKLINKLSKQVYYRVVFVTFAIMLISLIISDYSYLNNFSKSIYLENIVTIVCFVTLIAIIIYKQYKFVKENEKTEILLNFITKYEKIIDEDRMNRHEILNNLLSLKVFKNKKSKEFEDYLDELINNYNKSGTGIKNIYKLPPGLKGLFYYKISGLDEEKFKIIIHISNKNIEKIEQLLEKDYTILCKVISIFLDNAIEAASETEEKYLGIDIYKENKSTIIMIENSFSGKIDLDKINNIKYSTKGKNRGYGLYILKRILSKTNSIEVNQQIINNHFCSQIIIK